jgi:hypothetical protein
MTAPAVVEPQPILEADQLDEYLASRGETEDLFWAAERHLRKERSITNAAFQLQRELGAGGVIALGLEAAKAWLRLHIERGDVIAPEGVS